MALRLRKSDSVERSAQAAVECLAKLIDAAVRLGDDDRVLGLDEVLRHIEALMAAAEERVGRRPAAD